MNVLIVDDDPGVCRYVRRVLAKHDIDCMAVGDSERANEVLGAAEGAGFDLVLLDVSMPRGDGWELLEELRSRGDETPVIFLTAHRTVEDKVRGLRLGADDYVVKPFEATELIARAEAVVRRRRSLPVLQVGDLSVDLARRVVECGDDRIDVSPREFDLLAELAQSRGRVVSKHVLLQRVWGLDFDPGTKVVEVQIARLRRKLGRRVGSSIETIVGQGYRLVLPDPKSGAKPPTGAREPL